jgi:hypothetical protein
VPEVHLASPVYQYSAAQLVATDYSVADYTFARLTTRLSSDNVTRLGLPCFARLTVKVTLIVLHRHIF